MPDPAPPKAPAKLPAVTPVQAALLAGVTVVTLLIFVFRGSLDQLAALGYVGVFLVALLGNATLVLPAPVLLFVFAAGGTLDNFLLVGIVAGLGATIGEMTGYAAGYSGSNLVRRVRVYDRIHRLVKRYGAWAVAVLAFIPSPLFDLAGVAAGVLNMRWQTFLIATLAGKLGKTILVAWAGSLSIEWVQRLIS